MRLNFLPTILSFVLSLTVAGVGLEQEARAQTFDTSSIGGAIGAGGGTGGNIGGFLRNTLPNPGAAPIQPIPVSTPGARYLNLTVASTGSVDLNSVDMPFLRSNGGNGAFPSDAGTSGNSTVPGGGSGPQAMPDLPPGYVGVQNMHDGSFMGAIPPGGNIVDFFRGAYGIQPGQEGEASYILGNQLYQAWQMGMFAGMWGQYAASGPPQG